MKNRVKRQRVNIEGLVQGVGFRPFVHQLAERFRLSGWVRNDTRGVTIEIEGASSDIDGFVSCLTTESPPLAVIGKLFVCEIPCQKERQFEIRKSAVENSTYAQIAPDTHVCNACLQELFDPHDRRYRYPFINCTNCGPRYTIVTGIPYDRPLTTMTDFNMCASCFAEYDDPKSRRFHAQPNACPVCGPELQLVNSKGHSVGCEDPLKMAIAALKEGKILAIKGLGGYHLAVDATNSSAIWTLRQKKCRDEKPFAMMSRNLKTVRHFALVDEGEARLISGPERPIVLLRKEKNCRIADNVSPNNRYFGVMLPYTPMHHLLLSESLETLVMTSANLTDEPIVYRDDEALKRLSAIADYFLVHNRRIETRTDDSIAKITDGSPLLLRRSRGFVPRPILLPNKQAEILGVGAELKNTVCLTREDQAFLSQHVGDLKNLEAYESFKGTISHLLNILEVTPQCVAHDLHPDYYSSCFAKEEVGLPSIAVQHHHAHLVSCLVEHGLRTPVLGVIFDGIGYGEDGHLWGGEFLVGDVKTYRRLGHFRYQAMPGGDLATKEPWRMALSYLHSIFGEIPNEFKSSLKFSEQDLKLVCQAIEKNINTPLTSSCGRLFDAVSSLIGLRHTVNFEGQAALELEMIADPMQTKSYPYTIDRLNGQIVADARDLVQAVFIEHQSRVAPKIIAGRFHVTLADIVAKVCGQMRCQTGLDHVVLSGGVFQNSLLTKLVKASLETMKFNVLTHSLVPPNDGGLALGQAVVAGQNF